MSPPPVTRNPAKTLPQQQAQQKAAQQQNDTTPQKKVAKEPFHFDEDVGLGCVQGWFGQQGVQSMKSISETPQKGSDWIAEKKYEHIENRHQSDLKRHVQDLKEALGDIDGGNVLVGLRDLFKSDLDTLSGGAICDPPQKASAWTCQTWEEARRLPFDDGNLDNDDDTKQIVEDDTDNIQQQQDVKATGLGTIFGGVEGATEAHAICDPPQAVTAWHAEKDSMRLPFNGEGDLKLEGHHDLKCDDAAGGNTNTQQRGIGKQQMNVVTPSDLGKVFGGVEGATEAHAICDPPQQAGAWHAEKDSMRLPFNGEGNQKIEGQEEGGDIEAGANDDDTNLKPNINTQSQQQQRFVQPVTPCDLGVVFGGVEGFTENHAICDPPQKASAWVAEEDSMRPPFQTQAKHEQNVFMRRQQHAHQG